jgi:hypothetical protein
MTAGKDRHRSEHGHVTRTPAAAAMPTIAYLTLTEFRLATDMPATFVDEIEARTPGWFDQRLLLESANIDARLCKRYDAPFKLPYPIMVHRWLTDLVTMRAWLKRGVHSLDEQIAEYKKAADGADRDLLEAANSNTGLFDLPLRADTDASGVTRGFPRGYTEASPYVWADVQQVAGQSEDESGSGTLS